MTANPLESTQDSPPFDVVGLTDHHLPEAGKLFTGGYRAAREREPLLPGKHEDVDTILPKLRQVAKAQPGVAAVREGRLVGFLLGKPLPDFRGHRSIYVPEWAHGAAGPDRSEAYRAMYATLSRRWVADGCCAHLITTLADDREAREAFFWLGFGMIAVDAVRDLAPVSGVARNVDIHQARAEDAGHVLEFSSGIQKHMAEAPMFVPLTNPVDRETGEKRLADPAQAVFLASRAGEPVAYMHVQPANPSAAYVIQDRKTSSIKGAFTRPTCRGRRIGAALLSRAVNWAQSQEYERCAVDFEPQNISGCRFWLKHFRPVCYSMIRHIDERIVRAPAGREKGRTTYEL